MLRTGTGGGGGLWGRGAVGPLSSLKEVLAHTFDPTALVESRRIQPLSASVTQQA